MRKIFLVTALFLLTFAYAPVVLAANFVVTPLLIDVEAEQRDAFTKEIAIESTHTTHQRLFASVHEITLGEDGEIKSFVPGSMSDRATAITSWIEITRSRIDLQPGDEVKLPLTVRVNHNTPAGLYHAYIGLAQGSDRDQAEAKVMAGEGMGVILRIAVGGTSHEALRLVSFTTDPFSVFPGNAQITYTLQNAGDVPLLPEGDIIIYDGRGREIALIELDEVADRASIAPGEKRDYAKTIPFLDRLGKNKAFLSVEYGQENRASVYDTSFYYSIPWYYVLIIGVLLVTVLVSLLLLARRGESAGYDDGEVVDIPLFVGRVREHNEFEHDIDLKKKTTKESL